MLYPSPWLHWDKRGDVWTIRWDAISERFACIRVKDGYQAFGVFHVVEQMIDGCPEVKSYAG